MKYYKQLIDMLCFTRTDVENMIGNKNTANAMIYQYKKRGLIESVRRNLFVPISFETGTSVADRFVIASHIMPESYITHHSAFQFYGMTNQVYYELYVSTPNNKRFSNFTYNNITYCYTPAYLNVGIDIKYNGKIYITDLERTVIDSINDINKIAGIEEVLNCLDSIPHNWLNAQKMISYLKLYKKPNKGILYKKLGYILEHFPKAINDSEVFFNECIKHISKSKQYFDESLKNTLDEKYDEKWKLYIPKNLLYIISKGGMKFDL